MVKNASFLLQVVVAFVVLFTITQYSIPWSSKDEAPFDWLIISASILIANAVLTAYHGRGAWNFFFGLIAGNLLSDRFFAYRRQSRDYLAHTDVLTIMAILLGEAVLLACLCYYLAQLQTRFFNHNQATPNQH